MRVGAVTLAFNDEGTIRGTIRSLKNFVDKHIVLISEKPYYGEPQPMDGTEKICLDEGVEVVKGNWSLDNYQRNVGNMICSDCDWILGFDSDEMMTADQMERFLSFLGSCESPAVCNKPKIYWKTTDYILDPYPDYQPILAMKPNVRFTHIRNINSSFIPYEQDAMHHLSWCSPKDIYKKVMHYAHAPDYDWAKWYEEFYEKWDYDNSKQVKFPNNDIYEAKYDPLPSELKEYL